MANVTTDEEVVVQRDYSDLYKIKQTAIETLGEKYFGDLDTEALSVGELGFIMEQIGNITEDAFNTSSLALAESFPNKAIMPESIFTHAAIFQLDNTFTGACKCKFILLLDEKEILQKGTRNGLVTTFYLDRRTQINLSKIDDESIIPFILDYDIEIRAQKKQVTGSDVDYVFSAQYLLDHSNSISDVNDPYLKLRRTGDGHLLLEVIARQVTLNTQDDNIIDNTRINLPTVEFEFEEGLAGFDIYYKAPSDTTFTQLTPRIKHTPPVKSPFCYYKLKNENVLEISFTSKDGYFQPEFNATIQIDMYQTLGTGGYFSEYTGVGIEVVLTDEKYEYNQGLTIAAKPVSSSEGGTDRLSLEAIQALTIEGFSTAKELSTEANLERYFYDYKYRNGNEIKVIKRRDDITERLFSAFILMKNGEYIYPTNTLTVELTDECFDDHSDGRYTVQPGHLFTYKEDSLNTLVMIPDAMCYDEEALEEAMSKYLFVYTNPFLISVVRQPNLVGLYQTVTSETHVLDFISGNDEQFEQFITSQITLTRGLTAEKEYTMSVSIVPSTSTEEYITNLNSYEGNLVRVVAGLLSADGEEVGYIELLPTEISEVDSTQVTFSAKLTTDDIISSTAHMAILNAVKTNAEKSDHTFIPVSDVGVNIYILYDDAVTETNKFSPYLEDMQYFAITNVYSCKNDPLTFIKPMNMMRSTVLFSNKGTTEEPDIVSTVKLLPMIKADTVTDEDNFNAFINQLTNNYNYLEDAIGSLIQNGHIDVKFYNTYGKSSNYYIGDEGELIDQVNLLIKFIIWIRDGVDEINLRSRLITFIKEYIETINDSGTNDLYISNLIRQIEEKFPEVHHLKFIGINDYDTNYQTISLRVKDLKDLTKEERRNYVPEILVANRENIILSIMS